MKQGSLLNNKPLKTGSGKVRREVIKLTSAEHG
jgi:hypothetical protein